MNDEHIIPDWLKNKLLEERRFYKNIPVDYKDRINYIDKILAWGE